jgi:hypothetical protein
MIASYTQKDILQQLDYCAGDYTFPMFDNGYVYFGDTRLSAYRDEKRWAIVIEVLGYSVRTGGHAGLNNCLHCFGNCLNRSPGTDDEDFLVVTEDSPDNQIFQDECSWHIRETARNIMIRGVSVPLRLSTESLSEKGIEVVSPPHITGAELMRSLLPEHRDRLLATEEELRARIPLEVPMILRLEEWHHPDLIRMDLPSKSEAFQLLADVLVTGEIAHYQPSEAPNTHWKNWPESGSL